MASITVLPISNIGILYKHEGNRVTSFLAGTGGITAGQSFYVDSTTGTALPTTTATANKYQFRGIALETVGAGQAFDGLSEGYVGGYDLSGLAYDALVYAGDTAGTLNTATGTNNVVVGRVCPISDRDPVTGLPSKILYIFSNMNSNW